MSWFKRTPHTKSLPPKIPSKRRYSLLTERIVEEAKEKQRKETELPTK